jgi:hypothetical protein
MMARKGYPSPTFLNRPLNHVFRRPIVLNKIQVGGGESFERFAAVSNQCDALQKDLRQRDSGSTVHIDTPIIEAGNQAGEQPEIPVRPFADIRRGNGGVIVNDVCAHRDMDGNGDAALVSLQQQAVFAELRMRPGKMAPEGFPDAQAVRNAVADRLIDIPARFLSHAECALFKLLLHVLAGGSGRGNLKIVNNARSVQGQSRDQSAVHQIDKDGRQAGFDDMPPQPTQNRLPLASRLHDGMCEITKILRRQNGRQPVQEL